MRLLLLLSLLLSLSLETFGSGTTITHILKTDSLNNLNFRDSLNFFLDKEVQFDIEDMLHFSDSRFSPLGKQKLEAPFVLWSKVRLSNADLKTRDGYFRLFTFIDSIWMFTVQDGKVIDESFTGNVLKPWEKNLSTNQNNLPFTLYAGETKTYYFKMHYNRVICSNKCFSSLRLISRSVNDKERMFKNVAQGFYAGAMLLFGLVGIFMFFMFFESVFIYFSLLMFSFTAYFMFTHGLAGLLFNHHSTAVGRVDLVITISCVILSFTFFVKKYINLQERFPKVSKIYLPFAILIAFFPYILRLFNSNWIWITQTSDIMTALWMITTMVLIVWSSLKKDKSSIILLISIGILFSGSLLFIMGLLGIVSPSLRASYVFQIGTILFSIVLFYGLFNKINKIRSEKKRYEELDQMKSRFFANISHEFRTPLTLVMGPIKDTLENIKTPKEQSRLKLAYQNAERLLQLVNQLLDLSKLEANKMKLVTKEQNLTTILKGIVMSFKSLADQKNIHLNFVAQKEEIFLYMDKDKVEKIFYNLLSNAFKFTKENGEVTVLITDQKKHIEILVRDNGIGIPPARLPNIFNRFFQVESAEIREQEGSGIGLALVKELIQLHGAKISVESTIGKGTTFTILFPKGKVHLKEKKINFEQSSLKEIPRQYPEAIESILNTTASSSKSDAILTTNSTNDLPLVLIIEDNIAVRAYIKEHLDSSYRILEAVNGQDGIDKAFEQLPDLIISDVMMPHKNGYEVCAILKKDQRTSHIPLVLLTAKAATEEKLKGLETGADDYLIKPFNSRELEVRVHNLIQLRLQLRKQFSEAQTIEPQTAGTNSVDKVFLEKVCLIIETYLSHEQFNVDFLAKEVGLSRSHLNRKIKALTDQSTNKFIQSFRLQKAKEMLQQRTGNVSEIAMETGFKSTAYFVKCFGDKYGQTPGSFLYN